MDRRSFFFTLLAVPIAAAVASAQPPPRRHCSLQCRHLVGETPGETIIPSGHMTQALFLESRRFQREEIARIFNIPLRLVEHGHYLRGY